MDMIQHQRGTKRFTGTVRGEEVVFSCSCEVYPAARIEVKMTLAQAEQLRSGRAAKEVLTGYPRDVIELFTSGMTPAEGDRLFGGVARDLDSYSLYRGYSLDRKTANNAETTDSQQTLF